MAVRYGKRFAVQFDEVFPEGAYVVGEVTAVTEYQSQEDKARNRPVRPRIDEPTGLPIFKVTIADHQRTRTATSRSRWRSPRGCSRSHRPP